MNTDISESISKAIANLRERDCYIKDNFWYGINTLFPMKGWKKKRIGLKFYSVFADDDCGNEYLTNKTNQVFFWDHETDDVTEIHDSIIRFLNELEKTPDVKLKPGQVISSWIDPDFKPEFD